MSASLGQERLMKIDIMHALEDFLDAYDDQHDIMVVSEAISNAIDVGATRVDIKMGGELEDEQWVSFHNNGPPMNRDQFERYHELARSSKTKGKGIGFAGIGAKVYMAAWKDTVIHTETTDGTTALASDMYVKNNRLFWAYRNPQIMIPGTLYKVTLRREDYDSLAARARYVVEDVFDPAVAAGLSIRIDGKQVGAWKPHHVFTRKHTVKMNGMKFLLVVRVTTEDLPKAKPTIQYHVTGKIIMGKRPEWLSEIKPVVQNCIHAYVDATALSDQLNLNKTGFKQGSKANHVFKEVGKHIFRILKDAGYVDSKEPKNWEHNPLTKFFDKLFKDPRYEFLNPEVKGGAGPGRGPGTGGSADRTEKKGRRDGDNSTTSPRPKGGGGLKIVYITSPGNKREGWLDPATNQLMVNISHPLFIKYENNTPARNQRLCHILTSVLIKNSLSRTQMTADKAFDLQTDLETLAKDVMW